MKVIILGWLSICRRILTLDNLRRGMIVVNACLTCLREEESVDHLMVNCKTAKYIWSEWLGGLIVVGSSQIPSQSSSRLGRPQQEPQEVRSYGA